MDGMNECIHLLEPSECSLCLGNGDHIQTPLNELSDYVTSVVERFEAIDAFADWYNASPSIWSKEDQKMGIRAAGNQVRLDTLVGKLVGMRYLGSDQIVETEYGTRSPARAQVVDLELGKNKGNTLVFQEAIANEIRSQGSDWTVGVLKHEDHPTKPDYTMFVLDSEGVDLEAAEAAFTKAGIDINA